MDCTEAESWRDMEAQSSQPLSGSSKSVDCDVLEEDEGGLAVFDDPFNKGPDGPLVVVTLALAGETERLARDPAHDEIHRSTPSSAVERGKVTPDRCRIQPPFFHARCQYRGGICLPLDVTDRANAEGSEGEVNASDPGTHAEGT